MKVENYDTAHSDVDQQEDENRAVPGEAPPAFQDEDHCRDDAADQEDDRSDAESHSSVSGRLSVAWAVT